MIYCLIIFSLNLYFLDKSISFYIQKIKNRLIDIQNYRSMDKNPTPTDSGVLILFSCILSYSCLSFLNFLVENAYSPFLKIIIISSPLCIRIYLNSLINFKKIKRKLRKI